MNIDLGAVLSLESIVFVRYGSHSIWWMNQVKRFVLQWDLLSVLCFDHVQVFIPIELNMNGQHKVQDVL